jgi:hypothetical protein
MKPYTKEEVLARRRAEAEARYPSERVRRLSLFEFVATRDPKPPKFMGGPKVRGKGRSG